ncbi:helix-turn-helix domain-containing protein [Leifsonia sp. NPDC102414]|uniref:helix-turn-helix domain-containing protein n=1 Tax=unclassified Leifsonia TaxID=2663824 RepID=UPI000AF22A50|nr:helix-turn-helix transcriptional regulator [Leifsonia sp. Root227]
MIFGARVRNVRVELGLSQENVADLAQMHVTNYGKIERGVANPSLVTILRIASVFGVDVAALTAGLNGDHLPAAYSVLPAAEYLRSRHGNSLLGP